MKNRKLVLSICIILIVIAGGLIGLNLAGVLNFNGNTLSGAEQESPDVAYNTPVAESPTAPAVTPGGIPERYLHTSANGIETWDNGHMREDLTAIELTRLMGNGINLGNTMEAYGHKQLGVKADVSSYETLWGQPVTTQEIIDGMKAAGFDSLRIPVAWTNMMDFENGGYTIDEAYLNRVEEIINYGLNADMYVIINDHWDGGWWGMFGSAKQETRDAAMKMYISMWTQIAERYKEYSDYLIFESANEELGNRLNDKDICPDSGTLSEDECYEMNHKINQAFVDTVRGTGGNNSRRFLLIAGYNTDIVKTCDDRFVMPTDTVKNKLLISVHYYTPWGYCGNESLPRWGSTKDYNEQNELLAMMTKFTDQGYGVVIGEYMVALDSKGNVKKNACDFFNNLLDNCDMYGYAPMLWDCSTLYIRRELGIFDFFVASLFEGRSFAKQSAITDEETVAKAKASMEAALVKSASFVEENPVANADDKAIAWIMFNSGDWSLMYSVGDVYDPNAKSDGIVVTDVEITGPGVYTVGLDFTGTGMGFANGTAFSALAISNGELLYPGYIITINDIKVNGESYALTGKPYTTSDDKKCTRVNLYNGWVNKIPEEARTADGDTSDVSAVIVDPMTLGQIKTLTITFDYGPAK